MSTARSAAFRRLVFQLHLWTGLALLIPVVVLGLTGVALAWPEFFNRLTNPTPQVAAAEASLPASAYVQAAAGAAPGAKVTSLRLPGQPGAGVAVGVSNGRDGPSGARTVWLDPATAQPLATRPATSYVYEISHDLHGSFMAGGVGHQIVGWAGVLLLGLSATGIFLWWPRGGAMLRALRWRRTPDTLMNLHYTVGFWIAVPLAVVSLTGVIIAFPQLIGAGAPSGPPRPAATQAGPGIGVDQAVAAALAAHPGAQLSAISFPGAPVRGPAAAGPPAWRVSLRADAGPVDVRVNDRTGQVIEAPTGAPAARPPSLMGTVRQLHDGGDSLIWRWIVTLTGLLPLILAVTGAWYWAKLELRKARLNRERSA